MCRPIAVCCIENNHFANFPGPYGCRVNIVLITLTPAHSGQESLVTELKHKSNLQRQNRSNDVRLLP